KGGIRIHMQCGRSALLDYRRKYASVAAISVTLSAKQPEIADAVCRLLEESDGRGRRISALTDAYIAKLADDEVCADGSITAFIYIAGEAVTANELRKYVTLTQPKCSGVCAAFSGNDADGYAYALCVSGDVTPINKAMTSALNGRGGGRGQLAQGTLRASRAQIEAYFKA
ncbi:MAG: hypothetical protein WCQ72_08655, partial [Eubacteriales bacterium]